MISGAELAKWREEAKNAAVAAHIPDSEVDWLLQEVAGLDRLSLRLELFKTQPQIVLTISLSELTKLWQRRLQERLPVQYLVGVTPWRNFRLQVSPDVLIPRPETEYIIDLVSAAVKERLSLSSGHWVDLGTGSGAIAIGLADLLLDARIYGVDSSAAALTIAEKNALNCGFADKINFYQGSWWQPLPFLRGKVSGMVSNPPYIPSSLIPQLQPEVARHEPHLALDGGEDGLEAIRHLVLSAPNYLISGGLWAIELMTGQGQSVVKMLENNKQYQNIQIFSDFAGFDRFVLAFRC
jgi:release factor glutamine methyltransferase